MSTPFRFVVVPAMLAIAACAHVPPASPSTYAVQTRFDVGGDGRWDLLAVDEAQHRLFLSRSDHVQVVDTRSGKVVGNLDGTAGVHGIAVVPRLGHGFASNGKSNSVTEFDLGTLARIREIKVAGESPDAILFDPASGDVFVFNAHSNNASVIDPVRGIEVATIAFDGNPELAASDGKGHVYVNIEDKAQLVVIDAHTLRITDTWAMPGCEEPSGLALDAAHARLFSVCQNQTMVVTDAGNGAQVARLPIGDGPDGAAFDPATGNVFSPNGRSGTLTIAHEDDPTHFRVVQTLATQTGARTLAIAPDSHRLYLPAAQFDPAVGEQRPAMRADTFTVLVVAPARGG